jgi:HIRAN domain
MKCSIRGFFAFHLSLAIPRFRRSEPARTAADYELERFFIAGFQYHDGPELIELLEAGMELSLIHEKDNPHDPRAVAFRLGNSHIGYIPRQRNRTIAALLDQRAPLRARIIQVDPDGAPWEAVEVAVFITSGDSLSRPRRGSDQKAILPDL